MMTFTEDEVRRIIGKPVDIAAKYEDVHQHDGEWCLGITLDDEESLEVVGARIEAHSNFVADVTRNKLRDEQLRQMMKICGQS